MNTSLSRLTTLTAAAILLGTSTSALAQADDHVTHHPEQADTEVAAEQAPGMGGSDMQGMQGMQGRGMMQNMPGMMSRGDKQGDTMGPGMMPCPMMQGMIGMRGRGMTQDGPGMMSSGMMQGMVGHGMGMPHGLGPIDMLNLDEEQHTAIRKLHSDLRREHWDTLGRLLDEQETLWELYAAERRDPTAIGEAHERLFNLKRPLIEAMVETGNRIEALLSEEQRSRLKQLHRHGKGSMGDMGMMGPMGG